MGGDTWLVTAREPTGPCPACGAEEALPIVYGLPSVGDFVRLQGQVVFAGCAVPDVLHRWSCGRCCTNWGT